MADRVVLSRINIRPATRQQNGVAALDLLHYLNRCLVQFDAHRLSTGPAHCIFILRQRTLGILAIPGMRHGEGNTRWRGFQFAHPQLLLRGGVVESRAPRPATPRWTGETPVTPSYNFNSRARSRLVPCASDSSRFASAA